MSELKVYQIGLGSFGRHGFEKIIEMEKHLESVDLELAGVAEQDFEKREAAKKFAEANDIELELFSSAKDLYESASKQSGEVMIYDASPSQRHAEHIYNSINKGFYHLAEQPPSLTREEHLNERKMASEKNVFWKVDFVERESPVVKKALEMVRGNAIDSVQVFRESSAGIQKILQPVKRSGVVGGDILDKMVHEIYVLDFLEASKGSDKFIFEKSEARFFIPSDIDSDSMMDIYGGKIRGIEKETATGRSRANFRSGTTSVTFHTSWLGSSTKARTWESKVHWGLIDSSFQRTDTRGFRNEEARFFVIKGGVNLLGDMLHEKLYDLDSQEEIETPELMHDQLYRVIRKAVEDAAAHKDTNPSKKKIDSFMSGIFDAREAAIESSEGFYEELEEVNKHVKSFTEDTKIIEDSETGKVTG